jgi:hypothetical protein
MRRSSRISASREVNTYIQLSGHYDKNKMKCKKDIDIEFYYLVDYFLQYSRIPALLAQSYQFSKYFCNKLYKIFMRILSIIGECKLHENIPVFKYYQEPVTSRNILFAIREIIEKLPHEEYENKPFLERMSLETNDLYFNRMKMTSNIEDTEYLKKKDTTQEEYYMGTVLRNKLCTLKEVIFSIMMDRPPEIMIWLPLKSRVLPLTDYKECNITDHIPVSFFNTITKEEMDSRIFQNFQRLGEHIGFPSNPMDTLEPPKVNYLKSILHFEIIKNDKLTSKCRKLSESRDVVSTHITKEYTQLKGVTECPICMEEMAEVKMVSCGHYYCEKCFEKLDKCAICRVLIKR